jgi:hypothetical protein
MNGVFSQSIFSFGESMQITKSFREFFQEFFQTPPPAGFADDGQARGPAPTAARKSRSGRRWGRRMRPPLCPTVGLILALLAPPAFALGAAPAPADQQASAAPAPASKNPVANYQIVDLQKLVPATRMTDGTRAIFAPQPVRFEAKLAQGPSAQKAEYLKKVLGMMGISEIQEVSQRVVLEYGGDKPLAAYIEDKAAQRIVREAKVGGRYTFYAFHVYNNRQGPALVVTSFQETGKVGKE